jgi:hypothetical protein
VVDSIRTSMVVIACAAGMLAGPTGAVGQAEGGAGRAVLRELRAHQARFERVRRNHLPLAWGGGSGPCDERIGRFCLTHGSRGTDWEPEPEHTRVTEGRAALIEALAAGAALLPRDEWIAGQRVRYLVEAARYDDAIDAAGACGAERWWCRALSGFALHYAGRPADAESRFTDAIIAMPDAERARWTDLSPLLDDCSVRLYRRLTGRERASFETRFWRLADPFHTRPGNETRNEHLARQVWDRLQDRAESTEGIAWGEDLREIVIRYGWPRGWERIRAEAGGAGPPSMVSHYEGSDRDLLPPCEVLRDRDVVAGEWDQERPAPRTGYALPMPDSAIEWIRGMRYQVAVFRRGDSAVVVAAYEIPADSIPANAAVEAGIGLLTPDLDDAAAAAFPRGGHSDVIAVAAPPGQLLLTIEAVALEARRAARIRYGIDVARIDYGLIGISDLLLLSEAEPLPDSLASAVPRARRSTSVAAGERIGVYWETYGLTTPRDDEITLSLQLVEREVSWIRGIGRRMGLVDRTPPVLLRWRETPATDHLLARSVTITIPDGTRSGPYDLELTLAARGREPVTIRRAITVGPQP